MLNNLNNLDLTAKDIEMIEAALHTQKKILAVQSAAGGSGARRKLTDLKHLMKRINRNSVRRESPLALSWPSFARGFFCPDCNQPR